MGRPKKQATVTEQDLVAIEEARLKAEAVRQAQQEAAKALAVQTMTGDLRDLFLNKLRYEQDKRPWSDRSEGEQRETIHAVESAIQEAVRNAVELIAAAGLPTITGKLSRVVVSGDLNLSILVNKDCEQRYNLMDAQGGSILLVVADASQFMGERAPVEVTPDQGDIERVVVVHSSDDQDKANERAGWRGDRDAFPPAASPLN